MLDNIFEELKSTPEIVRFGSKGTPRELAEMKIIESNPTFDLIYCAPLLALKNILLISDYYRLA